MKTFDAISKEHRCEDIPNCPGRSVIRDLPGSTTVQDLLGADANHKEFKSEVCRDAVLVIRLPDQGGIITYKRSNGTYHHTLNTPSGLERKLKQLGIPIEEIE
jgi:hypothetical protein